ncbi:FAD-binding oxidoreductase [Acidisoma cellulosilytica]|uniref:FAD-binding oxidoreductase n=1 Tax=Acidisoma cellulosilyticum TaxID=2802395 RepID=A0A963Z4H6_9PROT|nr:FAD-binding oxidoreductase [Acidisoma cellulosilyticum]MCB8881603.1 FAD-binding oxidoreductase [Acidisoma cellulosilyticum]
MDSAKIQALKTRLDGIAVEDDPALVRKKSRDFYWYSPVLKRVLDSVLGEIVVTPKTEDEVVRTLAAAFALDIPVTPRGAGTGNYGQAMPLAGGMVLDLHELSGIKDIGPGYVIAEAGALLGKIDAATRAHSGQELRMFPSTHRTASIGGFIAGGSGGVGSIRWGGLRNLGNVTRTRVVTMEAHPRVLDLTGDDIAKVAHAYGTNGIITECEVPLTVAYDWIDAIIAFDGMERATAFADALGREDGILLKELSVMGPGVGHRYFSQHGRFLTADQAAVLIMVAPHSASALEAFTRRHRGETVFRSDLIDAETAKSLPPLFELTWNHTTLVARRVEPALTYLQTLYPYPDHVAAVAKMGRLIGDEMMDHLEFIRFDSNIVCSGLPLIRFTTEERLDEIIRIFEDNGCLVFNPHRYTLEEGGMKRSDLGQLAFKREVDPKGLLNPGKMIAWDNPDFDFSDPRPYLFSQPAA